MGQVIRMSKNIGESKGSVGAVLRLAEEVACLKRELTRNKKLLRDVKVLAVLGWLFAIVISFI